MELARSLGALARPGHSSEAHDRVRELGRRGVHAHLVHRVGRAVRGRAAAARGRVPQRRQLGIGPQLHGVRGAVAEPVRRRGRARRVGAGAAAVDRRGGGASARRARRGSLPNAGGPRAGQQPARQRVRLHGLPELPRRAGRGHVVRRAVRRVPLHLRQSPVGEPDWRSRLPLSHRDDAALGGDGAPARQRRRAALRLPAVRGAARRVRARGRGPLDGARRRPKGTASPFVAVHAAIARFAQAAAAAAARGRLGPVGIGARTATPSTAR